jgi:hypothetical protein
MADHGVVCSMSRGGNVCYLLSWKIERGRKMYQRRGGADVFDQIERFYYPKCRQRMIGYVSPMEFESKLD